jgi:hypothetical protein
MYRENSKVVYKFNSLGAILENARGMNKQTNKQTDYICQANGCHVFLSVAKYISVTGNVKLRTLSSAYKTSCEYTGLLISP